MACTFIEGLTPKNMNEPGGYEWLQGVGSSWGAFHWWGQRSYVSIGCLILDMLSHGFLLVVTYWEVEQAHNSCVMLIRGLRRHRAIVLRRCRCDAVTLDMRICWRFLKLHVLFIATDFFSCMKQGEYCVKCFSLKKQLYWLSQAIWLLNFL